MVTKASVALDVLSLILRESEFLEFNGVCAFSGRRRSCRQWSACGDFINLEDLPAQSLGGAHRGRVACVYS